MYENFRAKGSLGARGPRYGQHCFKLNRAVGGVRFKWRTRDALYLCSAARALYNRTSAVCNRVPSAPVSGVRGARRASPSVRAACSCAPYIRALPARLPGSGQCSSIVQFRMHATMPALNFVPLRLAASTLSYRHISDLCSSLSSALHGSLLYSVPFIPEFDSVLIGIK